MATVMDSERIGYRASTKNLVLRCSFKGNGFCFATSFKTWQNLHDEIFERFKFKKIEKIRIQYTLPGTEACFLENESNYKMLLFGAELYKFDFVELTVSNEDIFTSSSSTISHVDTFLAPEDEEDHLGPAFRCEVTKPFLSEEWKTYIVSVDQRFAGIHDFREKLKKYAIVKGFMYRFIRNDATRIHVICNSGGPDVKCNWYIKGTVSNANNSFSIAEMDNVHSCKRVISSHAHDYLDASIVASCILEEVMYNLTITPKTIISRFKTTYGFKISYKVALRAIGKAKDFLYGNDAKSFNRLKWFREAVLLSNPGSVFDLEKDSVTSRFKRLFIAYGGSIKGFQHCLPILYVDGAHGKSVYKGQILSATGRTGNKGIFPLAVCVCDSENLENWTYFFNHLKNILDPRGRIITFISDRGIGLLSAFDNIFPGNPHLYCYKHLSNNLTSKITGSGKAHKIEKVKDLFFKVAYSSTEKEYKFNLHKLKEEAGHGLITDFINEIPLEHWCRAFFHGDRYGIMANSIAECFNNWIRCERLMPVYQFLQEVRLKIMEITSRRMDEAQKVITELTPSMEEHLLIETDKSRKFNVCYSAPGLFEVRNKHSYKVDLNKRECSCFKWQINCFPCPHAIATFQFYPVGDVYEYIDPLFTAASYRKTYSFPLIPVPNVDEEYTDDDDEEGYILPPFARRPTGRPRNKRIPSAGEIVKREITCSRCKKKGNHNKATCTEPVYF